MKLFNFFRLYSFHLIVFDFHIVAKSSPFRMRRGNLRNLPVTHIPANLILYGMYWRIFRIHILLWKRDFILAITFAKLDDDIVLLPYVSPDCSEKLALRSAGSFQRTHLTLSRNFGDSLIISQFFHHQHIAPNINRCKSLRLLPFKFETNHDHE